MTNRRMGGLAQQAAALAVAVLLVAGTAWANEPPQQLEYVKQLEAAYGPPSQQGFGAAVFHEVLG